MKRIAVTAIISVCSTIAVMAAEGWLASIYRSDTYALSSTVSSAYTNTGDRVTLASIGVQCNNATGTWTIAVVNYGITNTLKTATVTSPTSDLFYDGYGMVPIGKGGKILISGSIHTNLQPTNVCKIAIHTRQ
jgi:hypothetical protein